MVIITQKKSAWLFANEAQRDVLRMETVTNVSNQVQLDKDATNAEVAILVT
jgi:hypothetical protein